MIIVSACLAGINCRYDGKSSPNEEVIKLVKEGKAILVCPEQLGGLPTPHDPVERTQKKFLSENGSNYSENFIKGAKEALKIAKLTNCTSAILKSKSPSCGSGQIYDGTFSRTLVEGNGIFADLLKKENIPVFTEKDI